MLEEFNTVTSTIIDEPQSPIGNLVSRNSTFIFGTAYKGPMHTPIQGRSDTVISNFGEVPLDKSFDTSLVRGYYEFAQSSPNTPDVHLIRVGEVAPGVISLYENDTITAGEKSYTLDGAAPSKSLTIKTVVDTAEYNGSPITVKGDESGNPIYMKIEMPDGYYVGYNLSVESGAPGAISKVSDLVKQINANSKLSGKIVASFETLKKTVALTITETGGVKDTYYDITAELPATNASWGDKLSTINRAYVHKTITLDVAAGVASVDLEVVPEKSMLADTPTFTKFTRLSKNETVATITPALAGTNGKHFVLYMSKVTGSTLVAGSLKVYVKKNGTSSLVELAAERFTYNATAVDQVPAKSITITDTANYALGDVYFASYSYTISYAEAKTRSELQFGNDRSYFVYGDTVIFGAEQPADMIIEYAADEDVNLSDISIVSYDTAAIEFLNPAVLPATGGTINLVIEYEPELPAVSGKVLQGAVIQPGSISGGSDGRFATQKEYLTAVLKAMVSVDLYPRKHNIIMGMYLDDTTTGFNIETGLPEKQPLNMAASILPYIERASNLTNECDLYIPTRPVSDLNQVTIDKWIDSLVNTSDTETARPANIIDSYTSFRADAPLGVFVLSIPEVGNGKRYFANPATVYGAFKANLAFDISATHGFVPGNVKDLGVKIFNAEIIAKLNTKRYTAAVLDSQSRYIWADAPTLAIKYRSQLDRQFVRDTVYLAVGIAREISDKYIGKPKLPQYITSIKKDVGKGLQSLVPDVLQDMFVDVVQDATSVITGRTKLRLILVTAKEMRSIDIETHIKLT